MILTNSRGGTSLPIFCKTNVRRGPKGESRSFRTTMRRMRGMPSRNSPTRCANDLCGGSSNSSHCRICPTRTRRTKNPANGRPPGGESWLGLTKKLNFVSIVVVDRPHFGRGRQVPPHSLIHASVKLRENHTELSNCKRKRKYKPRASYEEDKVTYVT